MIHSKALNRDKIPCTIDEWKSTAQNEVAQAKEKYNAGLTRAQHRNQQRPCDFGNFQNQLNLLCQQQSNLNHVPMDIDAANVTQFKKLTPEERAQLAKEGQCFQCRLQGHMA
jgi:carbamoylphosphate synthase small subunit